MNDLTTIQKEILYAIEKFSEKNGYSPSTRELCYLVNLSSTSSVFNQLNNLEKLGYIKRNKNKSRTIEVIYKNNNIKIPFINSNDDINDLTTKIDVSENFGFDKDSIIVKDIDNDDLYVIKILDKYIKSDTVLIKDNDKLIVKKYNNDSNILGKIIYTIKKAD